MMKLTKQQFCEAIAGLRKQTDVDKKFAESIDALVGSQVEFLYDNSAIYNALLFTLQTLFKSVDSKGNCMIEAHLYGGEKFDSDADLYNELIRRIGNGN